MSAETLRECECGCGKPTAVARDTDPRRGHTAGEPVRFVRGHNAATWTAKPVAERFWPKVQKTPTCWLWTAGLRRGYGNFRDEAGRSVGAHRWAYEALVGVIPEGLTIDHLCRVRSCVNPAHMEPVESGENSRRAAPTLLTNRCKRDHAFTPENTYVRSDGTRQCRACRRIREKALRDVG